MFVIEEYLTVDGKRPFRDWIDRIDGKIQQRILARIARFEDGHFGDHKKIFPKLFEARFFFGSGYRVYFAKMEERIVLLLCGGDKSRQSQDIKTAKSYLADYMEKIDA